MTKKEKTPVVPFQGKKPANGEETLKILSNMGLDNDENAASKLLSAAGDVRRMLLEKKKNESYCAGLWGGKYPTPKEYEDTKNLTCQFGMLGIYTMTGSGPGFMAAANEGAMMAKKQGGKCGSIGLSIQPINHQPPNPFAETIHEYNWIVPRLGHFDLFCDAYILMQSGGVGLFVELFLEWQQAQIEPAIRKPIILVGERWPRFLKLLEEDWKFRPDELCLVSPVSTTSEAFEIILSDYERFKIRKAAG